LVNTINTAYDNHDYIPKLSSLRNFSGKTRRNNAIRGREISYHGETIWLDILEKLQFGTTKGIELANLILGKTQRHFGGKKENLFLQQKKGFYQF